MWGLGTMGPMTSELLAAYDAQVSGDQRPTCARKGCGQRVDLPKDIGIVFCSMSCVPFKPEPIGEDGLPVPGWREGFTPGRRR